MSAPPKATLTLLRLFSRRERQAEVEGDLLEAFEEWDRSGGVGAARRRLWKEMMMMPIWRIIGAWRRSRDEARPVELPSTGASAVRRSGGDGGGPLRNGRQDLVHALRSLRKQVGFSTLAILTIAVGIGATTAVFSVTEAILLRPLPYPEPDRLVDVSHRTRGTGRLTTSRLDVVDLRLMTDLFEDVAGRGMAAGDVMLRIGGDQAFHASFLLVTHNYFSVLGVEAALGRTFVLEDGVPAAPTDPAEGEQATPPTAVVVISHGLWQRALGSDPNLVGRPVDLGGRLVTLVGVLPPDFVLLHERRHRWVKGTNTEIFVVWPEESFNRPARRGGPGARGILPLGRLQPGVSYEQAQAAMDVMAARLRAEYPAHDNEELRVQLYPLHRDLTSSSRQTVYVLVGGVAFLMLLVCANVANLMLVRARIRTGEDALRAALGCGRLRLFAQKLWESLILALAGGVLGIGLAWGTIRVVETLAPRTVPLLNRVDMNLYALLFGLVATVASVVISGLIPAVQASRIDPARILNLDSRGYSARGRRRLMNSLVVTELALSMVLLSGATVMARTLVALTRTDLGFEPEGLVTFDMDVQFERYRDPASVATLFARLEEELEVIPGAELVARSNMVPLSEVVGNTTWGWSDEVFDQQTERADLTIVTHDYFQAMGTRLLAGRFFTEAESADSTPPVIVDAKLAGIAWPNENPLGKKVIFTSSRIEGEVVGVVQHMLQRDFGFESYETIYLPERVAGPGAARTWVLRVDRVTEGLTTSIRRAVQIVDPSLAPYGIRILSDRVSLSMAPTRFVLFLMGAFAGTALVVAVIGLFGVIAYTVRTRTAELGIRLALGAEKVRVMFMVLRQGALLSLIGILGGTAVAFLFARFLESVVVGVSTTDPVALGATALILGAASILACYAPARWACSVDAARVLKGE
jgi:putative ABC transport system permease protein